MMARPFDLVSALTIVIVAAACASGGDVSSAAPSARDSAGIAIVETSRAPDSAAWVSGAPALRIGQVSGDPRFELTDIAGVIRAGDGSIIVADRGAFALRIYDSAGRFISEAGKRGEGPGEFAQRFLQVRECGSGVIVVREWSGRASWWTVDGKYIGSAKYHLPVQAAAGARSASGVATPLYSACSPNGRIIMTSWGDPTRQPKVSELKEGTAVSYPTWSKFWLVDTTGAVRFASTDTIIAERIMHHSSGGSGGSGPHMSGRVVSFALDSSRIFVSYGDRLEVSVLNMEGKPTALWRAPKEDLSFTDAMVTRYTSEKLSAEDSSERAYYLPRFELKYPSTYPAFDQLHLTPAGYLWARRYRLPWESTVRWGVFGPDGGFMGYTTFPTGLEVFEIDDEYVVGVAKDSVDVPFVQLHSVMIPRNDLDRGAPLLPGRGERQ